MRTAVIVGLVGCCLSVVAASPSAVVRHRAAGFGIMGDSDSDEYRADDGRGGAYAATTLNWMELLVRYRGTDFGPWGSRDYPRRTGYEYNWALSGARASDVVSGGQAAGLAGQVANGQVGIALLIIGANDFARWNGTYAEVYNGTVSGAALTAKIDGVVSSIAEALDIVRSAGSVQLFVATLLDRANVGDFPDAAKRQLVTDAVLAVNSGIVAAAASRGVTVVDLPAMMTPSVMPRIDAQGNMQVGGELITMVTNGDEPHHFQLSDTHAGTVAGGLLANGVIAYLNLAGAGIAPFTDAEMLENAGIHPANADALPLVWLTNPANGATVTGSVALAAGASDDHGVSGVRFRIDGVNLGAEDLTAPFSSTWNASTAAAGPHVISAIARDTAGQTATASVTVTVADVAAPTVAITAPQSGASVSGTIAVAASASDNVGVAGVTFFWNGTAIAAEDTQAPFSVNLNTTTGPNTTGTLTALARDAAGNTKTSAAVSVTVNNPVADTTPPTVNVTRPAPNATVSGSITVSATAADNKQVAGVLFLLDGAAIGAEDTVSPYSVSWNTIGAVNGSHTLTARARDAAGNTSSATAAVTVANASAVKRDVFPSSCSVTSGTFQSGTASSLAADDNNYFTAASSGFFLTKSAVECTLGGVTGPVSGLEASVVMKASRSISAVLEVYNVASGSWTSLTTVSVGTSEVARTATIANVANYIGPGGTMRVRVSSSGLGSYALSLDRLLVTITP